MKNKIKTKYILKNGCACIDKTDSRYNKYIKIKNKTGISPDEIWSLDYQIAKFIIPRLNLFRKTTVGIPYGLDKNEWKLILKKMEKAFLHIIKDSLMLNDSKELKEYDEGMELFYKHYRDLWN